MLQYAVLVIRLKKPTDHVRIIAVRPYPCLGEIFYKEIFRRKDAWGMEFVAASRMAWLARGWGRGEAVSGWVIMKESDTIRKGEATIL